MAYIAPHRDQLGVDGGRYGGFNCTAVAAGRATAQATDGSWDLTGAQIRAASPEPIPDPRSPGLNLDDIDSAVLKLTRGEVNFDVRRMMSASAACDRFVRQPGVVQFNRAKLISLGLGHGDTFGGGHAAKVDGVGGLHLDDPLTSRFPITRLQLIAVMGSLLVQGRDGHLHAIGQGYTYSAFAVLAAASWVIHMPKDVDYGVYPVDIATRRVIAPVITRHTGGFSAASSSPRTFTYPGHSSQSLVVVRDGFLADLAHKRGQVWAVRSSHARAA